MEHSPCVIHNTKHCTCVTFINAHNSPNREDLLIIPVLQRRKWRLRLNNQ